MELVEDAAGVDHEVLVGGQLGPPRLVGVAKDGDRVAVAGPGRWVDPAEQRLSPGRPAPPQVVGEVAEALEVGGEVEVVARDGGDAKGGHEWR